MSKGILRIKMTGDSSELKESLKDAEKQIGNFGEGTKAVGAAIGAATGVAMAAGVVNNMQFEAANDKVAAALGLTAEESERIGAVAGNLYADAYGGSLGEVSGAVEAVMSSISGMSTASSADLESLTAKVMDMAAAFEIDTARAAQVAGQLITTGLAKDGTQALDLLSASMQAVPKAVREDIVDAADEYSPFFQAIGIEGEKAFGLLVAGAQKGMFGIDKTGDAIKEFSILATDGSTRTKDAFKSIGLSATEMRDELLAGGERGSAAFAKIIKALQNTGSEAKTADAALALFGTPLEDLSATEIPKFINQLASADGALKNVDGTTQQLGTTLNDNGQTRVTEMRHELEMWTASLVNAGGPMGSLATTVMAFGGPAIGFAGDIGMIAVALKGLGSTALVSAAKIAASWFMAFWPVALITGVVIGLVVLIVKNWDRIKNATAAAWKWISDKVSGAFKWMVARAGEAVNWFKGLPGRILGALGNIGSLLLGAGKSLVQGFWNGIENAWDWLVGKVQGALSWLRGLWPFSPAKFGPFSGTGYTTYSGKAMVKDMAGGILSERGTLAAAAEAVMADAHGILGASLSPTTLDALTSQAEISARASLSSLSTEGAFTGPSAQPREIIVRYVLEVDGTEDDMVRMLRKAVKKQAAGSAERFFA